MLSYFRVPYSEDTQFSTTLDIPIKRDDQA